MKRILMSLAVLTVSAASALAVPSLQLYIPGATYTAPGSEDEESWVTTENSFDLYVIGQEGLEDVIVAVALGGYQEGADLSGVTLTVDGNVYTDWTWGTPPLATVTEGPPGDLGTHGIYDTYFIEFDAGDFASVGLIGDNVADNWDPSTGYFTGGNTMGEFKSFSIEISGADWVHFDAYTLGTNNQGATVIDQFAPFSHDAAFTGNGTTVIPEPTTLALFGIGLGGAAVIRRFRK